MVLFIENIYTATTFQIDMFIFHYIHAVYITKFDVCN